MGIAVIEIDPQKTRKRKVEIVKWHEKIPVIVACIGALYEVTTSGGSCHVVTDDNNYTDEILKLTIKDCEDPNNKSLDKELSKLICELLLQLSYEQRDYLFKLYDLDLVNNNDLTEDLWYYYKETIEFLNS